MPILKVSEEMQKQALVVLRLVSDTRPIDCPNCQSKQFLNGACQSCGFATPEAEALTQKWLEAQAQQQITQKAASFMDQTILPNFETYPEYSPKPEKCPSCKKKALVGLDCKGCGKTFPPKNLRFKRPEHVGLDKETKGLIDKAKEKFQFLRAANAIEEQKEKLRTIAAKAVVDPGARLDDSLTAESDATTRMLNFLQTGAQIDAQTKQQDANTSEEPQ